MDIRKSINCPPEIILSHEDLLDAEDWYQNINSKQDRTGKTVYLNNEEENSKTKYASNEVITSKYTYYNFLPKFLFENLNPMYKFANFYFLVAGILQTIPSITITNRYPSALISVGSVLALEGITQIYQDIKRHKSDDKTNNTLIEVYNTEEKQFQKKHQKLIKVGDIVKIYQGEIFPADMLFLASGDSKRLRSCWINTKSLDGETDNKYRQALECTACFPGPNDELNESSLAELKGVIQCENPNNITNDFNGQLITPDQTSILTIKNILLRGCILKNVPFIYGCVLSTGEDTKVEFKTNKLKWYEVNKDAKQPTLNKRINNVIIYILLLLLVLCLSGTFFERFLAIPIINKSHYLPDRKGSSVFVVFFRLFLLLYNFLPVSLYVSVTFIYCMQTFLLSQNLNMYDPVADETCRVRNMNLNDELGQVKYLFSDKTGTITANLMEFKKIYVYNAEYGKSINDTELRKSQYFRESSKNDLNTVKVNSIDSKNGYAKYANFIDGCPNDPNRTWNKDIIKRDEQSDRMFNFLLHICCNNTVTINQSKRTSSNPDDCIDIEASSPDEQAFISGAYLLGYKYIKKDLETNIITIEDLINKKQIQVELLYMFEYESVLKRMTVIIRMDSVVRIYCKGADSTIIELLDMKNPENNETVIEHLKIQLDTWSNNAYRTLVFAYKDITYNEYIQWKTRFDQECSKDANIQAMKQNKPNGITRLRLSLETDLIYQGATCIEDRLQDDVDITIDRLIRSGIHVWMITGDKVGTAKNIAMSCNLYQPESMEMIEYTKETADMIYDNMNLNKSRKVDGITPSDMQKIEYDFIALKQQNRNEDANKLLLNLELKHPGLLTIRVDCERIAACILNKDPMYLNKQYIMVIDELLMDFLILTSRKAFLVVAQICKAVVACRARKDQKAKLCRLIRQNNREVVTASIGDGANDVEMIKAAHIGIGIIGKEGTQAVNNSDYAISQFKYLNYLILDQGRKNYRGVSLACYVLFFRNIVFSLVQYLYQFFAGYTVSKNIPEVGIFFYGIYFVAFAPILMGTFDFDVKTKYVLNFPQLYRDGTEHKLFTYKTLFFFILNALYQSIIIDYFLLLCFQNISYPRSTISFHAFGILSLCLIILVSNSTCSLLQSRMWWWTVFDYWFCFLGWVFMAIVVMRIDKNFLLDKYAVQEMLFNPNTYLICILILYLCMFPSLAYFALKRNFFPSTSNMVQNAIKENEDLDAVETYLRNKDKKRGITKELRTIKHLPSHVQLPRYFKRRVSKSGSSLVSQDSNPSPSIYRANSLNHDTQYEQQKNNIGPTYSVINTVDMNELTSIQCREIIGPQVLELANALLETKDSSQELPKSPSVIIEENDNNPIFSVLESHLWNQSKYDVKKDNIPFVLTAIEDELETMFDKENEFSQGVNTTIYEATEEEEESNNNNGNDLHLYYKEEKIETLPENHISIDQTSIKETLLSSISEDNTNIDNERMNKQNNKENISIEMSPVSKTKTDY